MLTLSKYENESIKNELTNNKNELGNLKTKVIKKYFRPLKTKENLKNNKLLFLIIYKNKIWKINQKKGEQIKISLMKIKNKKIIIRLNMSEIFLKNHFKYKK